MHDAGAVGPEPRIPFQQHDLKWLRRIDGRLWTDDLPIVAPSQPPAVYLCIIEPLGARAAQRAKQSDRDAVGMKQRAGLLSGFAERQPQLGSRSDGGQGGERGREFSRSTARQLRYTTARRPLQIRLPP